MTLSVSRTFQPAVIAYVHLTHTNSGIWAEKKKKKRKKPKRRLISVVPVEPVAVTHGIVCPGVTFGKPRSAVSCSLMPLGMTIALRSVWSRYLKIQIFSYKHYLYLQESTVAGTLLKKQ